MVGWGFRICRQIDAYMQCKCMCPPANVVLQKLSLARLPGKSTDSWLPLRQWPLPPSGTCGTMLQLTPAALLVCMGSANISCVALLLGAESDMECCRKCVAEPLVCCMAPLMSWHDVMGIAMFVIGSIVLFIKSRCVLHRRLQHQLHFVS